MRLERNDQGFAHTSMKSIFTFAYSDNIAKGYTGIDLHFL